MTAFTTRVGCTLPIQLAGMGGIATPALAAAVANAGGLGMLGGVMLDAPALERALEQTRAQTSGPIGVNFLMPFLDREVVPVAARGARVVEFFYGDPEAALVEMVHAHGALAVWQVGSVREAYAAVGAGVDLLVVQGVEAGGHVRGTRPLTELLRELAGATSVPVIAAGGIGSAAEVAAALAAGAAAVRVGTRFLAARESEAHPRYVERLIAAGGADTALTTCFSVGWPDAPHRVLRSSIDAARALEQDIAGEGEVGGARAPIPRFAILPPTRSTTGAVDAMALYAGQSVGAVREVQSAAAIVAELTRGAA